MGKTYHFKSINTFSQHAILWIGTVSLAIALIIASQYRGTGNFEISIYQEYPMYYWLLLLVATLLGATFSFRKIFSGEDSYGWVWGGALITSVSVLILALPILRDYASVGSWDDLVHLSLATTILEHGKIDINNHYPIAHILINHFSFLTGLDLQQSMLWFLPLLYLVYIANTAFVAWIITPKPAIRGLIVITSLPLIFGTYSTIFRPMQLFVYTIPLLLGIIFLAKFRKSSLSATMLLIFLMLFFPFVHPWAVVSTATIFICFGVAQFSQNNVRQIHDFRGFYTPLLLLLVAWISWFTSFHVFGIAFKSIVISFIEGLAPDVSLSHYMSLAQQAGLSISTLAYLTFFKFGSAFFYFTPFILIVIYFGARFILGERTQPIYRLTLALFITIFIILAVTSLFRDLITDDPIRVLNIAAVSIPLFVGTAAYHLWQSFGSSSYIRNAIVIVLFATYMASAILGVSNSYFSPLIGEPSKQFTYAQHAGLEFFLANAADEDKSIYSPHAGARIFSSLLDAIDLGNLRAASPRWRIQPLPAHFDFSSSELSVDHKNPGYFWVTGYEDAFYTKVWPTGGRFTAEDFKQLATNNQWHKVYNAGDFSLWRFNN